MDLFSRGEAIYLIDTSALIHLDFTFKKELPVFTAIWEEIEDLIGTHRQHSDQNRTFSVELGAFGGARGSRGPIPGV